ncbi:hypothetical protein [Burkholderia plantarii]|uniref:hypothetical protein n=1 Tax=Burkholderia plantarii TaxID=41899 RepID=UPI0018DC642D|nr:hypothetical protein [Burkholderia plantarii]MBI0331713.1 hypothetical protein [Burkholderia plantarii]
MSYMAKATTRDLEQVMLLADLLESISKGFYPSLDTEVNESCDDTPRFFDERDLQHIQFLFQRVKACLDAAPGGLFRIVVGYQTILDNSVLDPDSPLLALHPRFATALERIQANEEATLPIDGVGRALKCRHRRILP